jgi:hypothetical protein
MNKVSWWTNSETGEAREVHWDDETHEVVFNNNGTWDIKERKMPKAIPWYVIQWYRADSDTWKDLDVGWLSLKYGNRGLQKYKTFKAAENNAVAYCEWHGKGKTVRVVERLGSNDYPIAEV